MFDLTNNRQTWFVFALILVVVAGVMYGSTPDLLQDTDDGDYFAEAEIAAQDVSHLFSSDRRPSAMGRPVIDVVFLVDYLLWKTDLRFYHYQVVFAHIIASFLLAFVFYRFGASLEISFLGALLFLCHVSHFRAVHWIASIGYPLSFIFALITVLLFSLALQKKQVIGFLGSAVALCLAVLTHPASASIFLFCVYLAWHQTRSVSHTLRAVWPLVLAAVFCVALSYWVYPKAAQTEAVDTPLVLSRMFETFAWYLSRLITAPHWVLVNFRDAPLMWELVVGVLGYGILFWVWWRDKQPAALFVVWVVVAILPFYNAGPGFRWTPAGPSRHLYFASAGISFLYAALLYWGTEQVAKWWGETRARVILGSVVFLLVGLSIYNDWRAQSVSFYASGRGYVARGDIEVGIAQFKRGIERDPLMVSPDTYFRLAQMLISIHESPVQWLDIGLTHHAQDTNLMLLKGFWMTLDTLDVGRAQAGQALLARAFDLAEDKKEVRFNAAVVYHNHGIYLYNQKDFETALPFFEQALVYNDQYFSAAYHLGQICWILDRDNEAIQAYQRALEIAPENAEPYLNIAKIFLENERLDLVKDMAELVIGFDPQEAEAYDLLGVVLQSQGDLDGAEKAYRKTLSLNPNMIASHLGLAELFLQTQPDVARQHYRNVLAIDPENSFALKGLERLGP